MEQVADWLEKLGLGQYAQRFAENDDLLFSLSSATLTSRAWRQFTRPSKAALKAIGESTDLKGIAGPVRAWAALRPSAVESRFEALHASGLTELVGREEELEILLRRWSKAKTAEGQVVLLSGEAGIGKSRRASLASHR